MIKLSLFMKGFADNAPQGMLFTEPMFRQLIEKPPVRPHTMKKSTLSCFSPALFPPGRTRANDAVEALSCLVYDFDVLPVDGWEKIVASLKAHSYNFALHTTWGHHPQNPRARLIIPLASPVKAEDFSIFWQGAREKMGFVGSLSPDTQAKDLARMYVLPVIRGNSVEYKYELYLSGEMLDPSTISEPSTEIPDHIWGDLVVTLEDGDRVPVRELVALGNNKKHKCTCPFQPDASAGSAYIRVTPKGRAFLQCMSERHDHFKKRGQNQFWYRKDGAAPGSEKKKSTRGPSYRLRAPEERKTLISEIPQKDFTELTEGFVYHGGQGVFYRWGHITGGWEISCPISKGRVTDSFVGRIPAPCDLRHVLALVDHLIENQVYRMDHDSSADAIIELPGERVMNLYSEPSIVPESSPDGHSIIAEMVNILSGNDPVTKEWLIHWSAALIQRPERRGMTAVLSVSAQQGIGKSLYGRILARMIGEGNSATVSNRSLRDNFNSSYITALLVLADEVAVRASEGDVLSELKSCITDARVPCLAPYAQRTEVTNRMTWWLTSNQTRPLMLERDDRRISVMESAPVTSTWKTKISKVFQRSTGELTESFEAEIADYYQFLVDLQVDWGLIARPVHTDATDRLKEASRGSVESYISDLRDHGLQTTLLRWPPEIGLPVAQPPIVACETLYSSYRVWCQRHGRRDTRSEVELRLSFQKVGGVVVRQVAYKGTSLHAYMVKLKT